MNLDLKEKNAIVCGSTQGIGEATAIELAKLGANITLIARDKNIIKIVQVILFSEASALLALVNIELPLAAIPPMPSPLGL